jgi:hypothetical protein
MPGVLTHLTAGIIIFAFSSLILKKIYNEKYTRLNLFLLGGVCIVFSIVPDFPLGLYYALGLFSYDSLLEYHILVHKIISPVAIVGFLLLRFSVNMKREFIWEIGIFCIIVHVVMDMFIQDHGIWF